MKSDAARIRLARRAAELTQAEVAAAIGVGRSAVAQWECAQGSRPSTAHLEALAKSLRCSFEWLATGRGQRELRFDSDEGAQAAVQLHVFAQDDDEERVLRTFRRLDGTDREIVLTLADSLSAKAITVRKARR